MDAAACSTPGGQVSTQASCIGDTVHLKGHAAKPHLPYLHAGILYRRCRRLNR
jgi:hypothetical protein